MDSTERPHDAAQRSAPAPRRAWAAGTPPALAESVRRWGLTGVRRLPGLTYNVVAAAALAGGTPVVLKLRPPGERETATEIAALRLYDGRGAVRLLDADAALGALLLERLSPGGTLAPLSARDDAAATAAAAEVMRRLRRPPPPHHPFPSVAGWARAFADLRARHDGGTGPLPAALVDLAERLFAELLASGAEPVVIHGDLHHTNILAAGREPWLAIDPAGVVGEPAYETGALLRNPIPAILSVPDAPRILARRRDQLAEELGFDRRRVRDWAVAQAVLAAAWSAEDADEAADLRGFITLAGWLNT